MFRRNKVGSTPQEMRYVLYARKSTEDKGSQERSIDDQIKDCKAMAERDGLHIVKIIREEKSAKVANNRPQFSQMLKDIEDGKYDGIISWHPDRLSRNSLEAGMIVDALDNDVIKDLKFPTCLFENNSTGKMLLNILFAISKQYSEHISEGVLRAYDNSFEEGKSVGTPKWGYNRNKETGLYEPDENFDLIRKAWDMKLAKKTTKEIVDYLLLNGVKRTTKLSRKVKKTKDIKPNENSIGNMFRDPFYYGVLVQAEKEIDLREVYDFIPMVSEDEYGAVQAILQESPQRYVGKRKKERAIFYPLRGIVYCGVCGRPMYVGASSSSNKKNRYLYYRCDNKECKRKQKSVRANIVFDAFYDAVAHLMFDNKQFQAYERKMDSYTDERKTELFTERRSLLASRRTKDLELGELVLAMVKVKDGSKAHEVMQKKIAEVESRISEIDYRLQEISSELNNANQAKLTKDEFLNLMKTLPEQIENGSIVEKDILARLLFLNCTIDEQNKATFLWKEPYATILNGQSINSGAPTMSILEQAGLVAEAIYRLNDPTLFIPEPVTDELKDILRHQPRYEL